MTNDEYELYEFSLYSIRELHTNHELRITNREYTHSVAAPLHTINSKLTSTIILYTVKFKAINAIFTENFLFP